MSLCINFKVFYSIDSWHLDANNIDWTVVFNSKKKKKQHNQREDPNSKFYSHLSYSRHIELGRIWFSKSMLKYQQILWVDALNSNQIDDWWWWCCCCWSSCVGVFVFVDIHMVFFFLIFQHIFHTFIQMRESDLVSSFDQI